MPHPFFFQKNHHQRVKNRIIAYNLVIVHFDKNTALDLCFLPILVLRTPKFKMADLSPFFHRNETTSEIEIDQYFRYFVKRDNLESLRVQVSKMSVSETTVSFASEQSPGISLTKMNCVLYVLCFRCLCLIVNLTTPPSAQKALIDLQTRKMINGRMSSYCPQWRTKKNQKTQIGR